MITVRKNGIAAMRLLYTQICSLSPILVIYSFTYSSFTILDTCIVTFYFISFPFYLTIKQSKLHPFFLSLFVFVTAHAFVDYFFNSNSSNLLRAMHLANYIFFLSLYNRVFFDKKIAIKTVGTVAIISTLFLILQHALFSLIHLSIPGQLPIFLVNSEYGLSEMAAMNIMRFSSFFLEPSHYAMYVLCALTLELFYKEAPKYISIFLLCLGAIVSTSNTALVGMAFVLFLYVRKKGISMKMLLFILLSIILVYLLAHTYIEAILFRVDAGNSFDSRFNGYSQINELLSSSPLWGIGFWSGNEMGDFYLPGWARLYVYLGIIGMAYYLLSYLTMYRALKNKLMFILTILFNFGSDTLFSVFFLFFSSFFILKKDEPMIIKHNNI